MKNKKIGEAGQNQRKFISLISNKLRQWPGALSKTGAFQKAPEGPTMLLKIKGHNRSPTEGPTIFMKIKGLTL
jgi:hypothetical protein